VTETIARAERWLARAVDGGHPWQIRRRTRRTDREIRQLLDEHDLVEGPPLPPPLKRTAAGTLAIAVCLSAGLALAGVR